MNIACRWRGHLHRLRTGSHHSRYLQRAWDKYGASGFIFQVLETCLAEELTQREQHWLDTTGACSQDTGFNVFDSAEPGASLRNRTGWHHSNETRAKMRASRLARVTTPAEIEHYRRLAAANIGSKASLETRLRQSAAKSGRPIHPASRAALLRLAETRKGIPRPPHVVAAMAAAHRGKPLSAEHRAKLSIALAGRSISDETRERIAAAACLRWSTSRALTGRGKA